MIELVEKLHENNNLTDKELKQLIETDDKNTAQILRQRADETRRKYYGNKVFLRGLIEISSFCRNDCLYCGIRCSNKSAERFRLTENKIISCAESGYKRGFRTFVLQGGEDDYYTDERMCRIITQIKEKCPDCAVTLSLGERTPESYRLMKRAGADRYLLRHEAADTELYQKLHPPKMILDKRINCLYNLKVEGYQVGAGFMVGAPFQTVDNIIADLRFLQNLNPHMVGIGPFVPHHATPFSGCAGGTVGLTVRLLGIIRLMLSEVLLPATTALGTISPDGRILGLQTGCNVVMPNISPDDSRDKYELYNNKSTEELSNIIADIERAGYEVSMERGDCIR
ncbi:MAG: [FeFe] hydrogenase H-cluster radical SAM maturase HydE [Ruminococcus sp.]|nr:[FeFe] hydrogenase H-cluster radical SAM maturase HydE [Ruminococcus sp.]